MRRHVLALIGAVALAAPMIATGTAQAALQPRDAPNAPTIRSVNPGPEVGQITLDWDAPSEPGGTVVNYQIEYLSDAGGSPALQDPTGNAKTIATIGELSTDRKFSFSVRAQNGDGWGEWAEFTAFVAPASLVKPTSVTATPKDRSILIQWTPASTDFAGSYVIESRESTDTAKWLPVDSVPANTTSVLDKDATQGTSYFFRVRAVIGSQVSGWETTTRAVAPGVAPEAPTYVKAVAGNAAVDLSWGAPSVAPDTYSIQYCPATSLPAPTDTCWRAATPPSVNSPTTSTTVTGLSNGTAYFFRVQSVRASLTSEWKATSEAVTPSGSWAVPAAPTSVNASPGNGLAYMYWSVPTGNPATSYNVQFSTDNQIWLPVGGRSTGSTALSYTLTGLANGVPYYIRVQTVNGTQTSGWTQMSGVVIPAGIPGPPTNVAGVPGNGQVLVTWSPPAYSAAPVTGYRVQYSVTNGVIWVTAADLTVPSTSVLVSGLSNGTGYIFRVQATSQVGDGTWSTPSATIVPPGGPNPPTGVTAVAGNASATVSWTASAVPSGFPVISYRVAASPGGQTCSTTAAPPAQPATSCVVSGLTNGQAYTFTVVAVSAAGVSVSSAPSPAVVPAGGPNPPTAVTAVAGDRSATVSWTAPTQAAGGPISSYRATSSPDGRTCTVNAPATTCTVSGLTNGQPYTFTVVAISATGTSASSAASAPVTPFTTQVTIRITDSSRNGSKVVISGTTQGMDPGDTLQVLTRTSAKGQFQPTAEITVRANGTFRWSGASSKKTWIRVTDGDVVSNTVIVPVR